MITVAVNAKVDPVVVALATKHNDPKSFLGYIEASPQSVMAADLAIAVAAAAKSSRRRSRFVAGIDLDLPSDDFGVDSSSSLSSSSSSLAVCLPVSHDQKNIVVPDLAPVVASSTSAPKSGNVYNFPIFFLNTILQFILIF